MAPMVKFEVKIASQNSSQECSPGLTHQTIDPWAFRLPKVASGCLAVAVSLWIINPKMNNCLLLMEVRFFRIFSP